jgi:uncharacterized membrane protein
METKRIVLRVVPWQAGKVAAVMYFAIAVLFCVPMALISWLIPRAPNQPGPVFFLMLPILYALAGLIFVPLTCWLYNKTVKFVGGIEVVVDAASDA